MDLKKELNIFLIPKLIANPGTGCKRTDEWH